MGRTRRIVGWRMPSCSWAWAGRSGFWATVMAMTAVPDEAWPCSTENQASRAFVARSRLHGSPRAHRAGARLVPSRACPTCVACLWGWRGLPFLCAWCRKCGLGKAQWDWCGCLRVTAASGGSMAVQARRRGSGIAEHGAAGARLRGGRCALLWCWLVGPGLPLEAERELEPVDNGGGRGRLCMSAGAGEWRWGGGGRGGQVQWHIAVRQSTGRSRVGWVVGGRAGRQCSEGSRAVAW